MAEGQVAGVVAMDIEFIGIGKLRRITIGGVQHRMDTIPTQNLLAAQLDIDLSPREYVLSGDPDNTYSLQSRFMSSGSRAGAGFRDEDIVSTPDNYSASSTNKLEDL